MGLITNELLPYDEKQARIGEQISSIRRSHGFKYPAQYAFSWVMANQVVQHLYSSSGIDAIPIWRDNVGWSQFNLTRAATCQLNTDRNQESQRYIVFDAIAVNWKLQTSLTPYATSPREAHFDFYQAVMLRNIEPWLAIEQTLEHLGLSEPDMADHSECLHALHSYTYTKLIQVATDLICSAPEMVVIREMAIDLDQFGNPFDEASHPLRQAGLAVPGDTHDWLELFHIAANCRLYINLSTGDTLYLTPHETMHLLDPISWNNRNEEQLLAHFADLLHIPLL